MKIRKIIFCPTFFEEFNLAPPYELAENQRITLVGIYENMHQIVHIEEFLSKKDKALLWLHITLFVMMLQNGMRDMSVRDDLDRAVVVLQLLGSDDI